MKKSLPNFYLSLFPLVLLVVLIISGMTFLGSSPHIPMLIVTFITILIAMLGLGYSWEEVEEGIKITINNSMSAILILMIVGVVVGTWMQSGVVPTMIYYGMKIISPKLFLPCALIICSIVGVSIGSSWTTVATVGIALVGIGTSMGFSLPLVAGCVISGAYFGDKMSPFSDTTNLAPAMVGVGLYEHIRHMFASTAVTYVICLILYSAISITHLSDNADLSSMESLTSKIAETFNISSILLLIPVIVIVMAVLKIPAMIGLITGSLMASLISLTVQHASLADVVDTMHHGFHAETRNKALDSLLSRGGLDNMMWTVSLILLAMMFAGVMEKTRMLESITAKMSTLIRGRGSLVLITGFTSILMNFTTGEQMLSIIVPGKMYKHEYERLGLHPVNLSRVTEDCGTITSSLIPWNGCGAYMIATLGLTPWVYVPFCFFNIINPLVSFVFGFTGFTMKKLDTDITKVESEENEQ